jgi:hypothetical protein
MRAPVGSVAEPVSGEFKEILQEKWRDLPFEIVYAI